MYSRCSDATTKTTPATFAPTCSSTIGCASASAMIPHNDDHAEHGVVHRADVAAAPARTRGLPVHRMSVIARVMPSSESSCVLNRSHAPRNAIAPARTGPDLPTPTSAPAPR